MESWWIMVCECKELDDCSFCKYDYMWNPSMCDCECNKPCKIDEYLFDIKNCSCKKRLFGKLVLVHEHEILLKLKLQLLIKK